MADCAAPPDWTYRAVERVAAAVSFGCRPAKLARSSPCPGTARAIAGDVTELTKGAGRLRRGTAASEQAEWKHDTGKICSRGLPHGHSLFGHRRGRSGDHVLSASLRCHRADEDRGAGRKGRACGDPDRRLADH